MSIQYVILGFLSRRPATGYDLKKQFVDSDILYWSGSNNQIYRSLVKLHEDGLVTREIHHQDDNPDRKVYNITEEGRAELRNWVLSPPELPTLRNHFHVQLLWADQVSSDELNGLLGSYEEELQVKILMMREQAKRRINQVKADSRESQLWQAVMERWISYFEQELDWVRHLKNEFSHQHRK